ncbi:hypothetical protein S245_012885 [Arachis hypogaea]
MYEAYEASQLSDFATTLIKFTQFAKAKFDWLAQNLHIRFIKSLTSIISELISKDRGLQIHSLAQLQYYNLTVVPDHIVVTMYFCRGINEVVDAKIQSTVLHIQ